MTIGYVAHSYHVPPHVLYQALKLTPASDHLPLDRTRQRKLGRRTQGQADIRYRPRPLSVPAAGATASHESAGIGREMTDQLLELLTSYGLPALFGVMVFAAAGMPFPSSVTLIAMGSFVAQGELSSWSVILVGATGAIVGDQLGYAFGLYGGRPLLSAVTCRIGGENKVEQAEAYSRKWAG